ncbi:MAG TPA: hypothetical protein PKV22_00050 [Paludibacteraceae bacterium]|nr:hypothetical protein [Paludibacteraceae bacterium]
MEPPIIILPKDIMRIFDCRYKKAYNTYKYIKDALGKDKKQVVSIDEFCQIMDIKKELVEQKLIK